MQRKDMYDLKNEEEGNHIPNLDKLQLLPVSTKFNYVSWQARKARNVLLTLCLDYFSNFLLALV